MDLSGPYDGDKCAFCGKSAKNGTKHVAGYQRYETYARVGKLLDACQSCAEKPYKQPEHLSGGRNEQVAKQPAVAV